MSSASVVRRLHKLARLYGIQTVYYDVHRHRQPASTESLLALLRCLGAPIASLEDVASAWRERRQDLWQRLLEPVTVARDDKPAIVPLRLPSAIDGGTLNCHLKLEDGQQHDWQCPTADLLAIETAEVEGERYAVRRMVVPYRLPRGYHHLTVKTGTGYAEGLIISAPKKAFLPKGRTWGAFLPLYALHTGRSWGGGDYRDMEALVTWLAGTGAQVIATLPLLATFPDDASPYLPVSRLFWNEFYVAIDRVPELTTCPTAQALVESSLFKQEIDTLRSLPLVDYPRQMRLKRKALEELCRCLFGEPSSRLEALQSFAESNPLASDYARFRATGDKHGWASPPGKGELKPGDYDEDSWRYYLYAQWLAHQQMGQLSTAAREKGLRLYLDLPLGVHPDGYDVWRQRNIFVTGASTGAPPDIVFTRGQDWSFPPLHPQKIREQGYGYVIAYLRHHLQHAGILRLDHVMGLHHLYCIPRGMEASQGAYIRYPADELYAILCLESHRHRAIIAGEDLGTVPHYVRPAMSRHGLYRTYVLNYELAANQSPPVPQNSIAGLGTHDMPPFASFWRDMDIQQRLELGILDGEGANRERQARQHIRQGWLAYLRARGWVTGDVPDACAAFSGSLSFLAASRARVVLVNLEDLWLETMPQNIPSTTDEYPNWQRKARYSLDQFCQMPQVADTLHTINHLRKQGR